VKGCGKSAPRQWQHWWQGKPHREQNQIEMTSIAIYSFAGAFLHRYLGWLHEALGNERPR